MLAIRSPCSFVIVGWPLCRDGSSVTMKVEALLRATTERGLTGRSMTEEIREVLGPLPEAVSAPPDGSSTQPPSWPGGLSRAPLSVNLTIYAPSVASVKKGGAEGDRVESQRNGPGRGLSPVPRAQRQSLAPDGALLPRRPERIPGIRVERSATEATGHPPDPRS